MKRRVHSICINASEDINNNKSDYILNLLKLGTKFIETR